MPQSKSQIKISIPNPCNEDWDKMTPDEKGRFCQHCQKVVIDFSIMADEDISRIFLDTNRKGKLCGRFLTSQLSLLSATTPGSNLYGKGIFKPFMVAGAVLLSLFTNNNSKGQSKTKPGQTKEANSFRPKHLIIRGILLDFETRQPISGRMIYCDTQSSDADFIITDSRGHFSFTIQPANVTHITLSAEATVDNTGYIPNETILLSSGKIPFQTLYQYNVQTLPIAKVSAPILIHRVAIPAATTQVNIIGDIAIKFSWKYRLRRFLKRIF